MDDRKGLTRHLQISLGEKLREYYSGVLQTLPPDLVLLARKIRGDTTAKQNFHWGSEPLENIHVDSFDPETVAILDEAFERAWRDLDHLTENPATRQCLATRLFELLKEGERNPSRLATKAVLELVAPHDT